MDPDSRRILMMSVIIMLGVVLILFDVSLWLLIALTTLTGVLLLGVSSSLNIPPPTTSPKPLDQRVTAPKKNPMNDMKEQRHPSFVHNLNTVFSNLANSTRWWPSHETKKVVQVKKIDEMLDTLIAGYVPPTPILSSRKTAEKIEARPRVTIDIDPLKELSHATLEDDLLVPTSIPSDAEVPIAEGRVLNPAPGIAGSPEVTRSALDNVEMISTNQGQDIEGLMDLEELDFTNIELEYSSSEGKQTIMHPSAKKSGSTSSDSSRTLQGFPVTEPPTGSLHSTSPVKMIPAKSEAHEGSTFAMGSNRGDDLMLALRSEVSQVKKPKDMSLFREMKDTTITAKELSSDLEQISSMLTTHNSKRKEKGMPLRTHQDRKTL